MVSDMGKVGVVDVLASSGRTDVVSSLFLAHYRRLAGLASLLVDERETAEDVAGAVHR